MSPARTVRPRLDEQSTGAAVPDQAHPKRGVIAEVITARGESWRRAHPWSERGIHPSWGAMGALHHVDHGRAACSRHQGPGRDQRGSDVRGHAVAKCAFARVAIGVERAEVRLDHREQHLSGAERLHRADHTRHCGRAGRLGNGRGRLCEGLRHRGSAPGRHGTSMGRLWDCTLRHCEHQGRHCRRRSRLGGRSGCHCDYILRLCAHRGRHCRRGRRLGRPGGRHGG